MATKIFLVLLLAVTVCGMPKMTIDLKEKIMAEKVSSLLMPGPVVLPSNNTVEVQSVEASPECILCEYVMDKLDKMLTQNSTEEQIKEALEKVCTLLPPTIGPECKEFVDKYTDLILKYLSQGMNPQMVCAELGLCAGLNEIEEYPREPIAVVDINEIKSTSQCELCEAVAKQLDSLITQNTTQQEIEKALEQICNLLPAHFKDECNQFVEQYVPEILNLLALEIPPDMLCKELGLCPAFASQHLSLDEVEMDSSASMKSNITCEACIEIIQFAKTLAAKNETLEDLEKALKLICGFMLPVYKQCKDFIDNVIPEIFNELKKMDPDAICKQLKLCPESSTHNDFRCFLSHCSNPELSRKCNSVEYCKMVGQGQK